MFNRSLAFATLSTLLLAAPAFAQPDPQPAPTPDAPPHR